MQTSPPPGTDSRPAASIFGLGAVFLIATCVFYVVAGPEAALPGGARNATEALRATPDAAPWMHLAGTTGMLADIALAVGAAMLAFQDGHRRDSRALGGWLAIAVASAIFVVVDAMVAVVLPFVGTHASSPDTCWAFRLLFDVLFAIGAWAAGLGALAVASARSGALARSPGAMWLMRVAGIVSLVSASAQLLGFPAAQFIGVGITILALASMALSAHHLKAEPAALTR
jgi:hypothetical protein